VDGQLGNFNHSQAKKKVRGAFSCRAFSGSNCKLNAQGAKCQSCVCLEPCLFDGDDDIVGTVSILQNFAAVIVKFAHLLFFSRKFFEIVLIPILSDVAEVTAHKGGSGMAS